MATETTQATAQQPATEERHERQVLTGRVTSAKMEKTIVVEVLRLVQHPKYRRVVRHLEEILRARRKARGQAGRHRADRRHAAALEAEALAVEGNRDAQHVGGITESEEQTNDSDANLADRRRQFRRAQADVINPMGGDRAKRASATSSPRR